LKAAKDSLETVKRDPTLNQALGCILGAFIGDAAGGVLEFSRCKIQQEHVDHALTFPGGGCFKFEPGELTDDSEMAMSLFNAILEDEGVPTTQTLAKHYLFWQNSHPKDMGFTTRAALDEMYYYLKHIPDGMTEEKFYQNVAKVNNRSKSNGCLMRATPLSVLCHNLSPEDIYKTTAIDVKMTHSNPACTDMVAMYNIAIGHLINNPKDNSGAIKKVSEFLENIEIDSDIMQYYLYAVDEEDLEHKLPPATSKIGWAMIAFSYSFHYLKLGVSYEEAISRALLLGGDTDTNAAIVGGMMGACHGFEDIPEKWVDKVVNAGTARPKEISLQGLDDFEEKVKKLIELCP